MYDEPKFLPAGDCAMVVEIGDSISPETNRRVHGLLRAIEGRGLPEIVDLVPTYRSLLVQYNPMLASFEAMQESFAGLQAEAADADPDTTKVVEVPTLYGGKHGPDLDFVAEHNGLSPEEVVELHSETEYLVYMLGFTPGFPYLGGLSERLHAPRLETPRPATPGGSVGIAEGQTGVYPVASPGGWRIIGRTPLQLFDAERRPPSLLTAGDLVRFVPLTQDGDFQLPVGDGV
ncbi:MAG: 5-oxoprolinase subunit PxpB [Vicinamibacterales bacterium]|nr:5-oxoprolinase subunit PxpB [Vicinamibacterales bacterium]